MKTRDAKVVHVLSGWGRFAILLLALVMVGLVAGLLVGSALEQPSTLAQTGTPDHGTVRERYTFETLDDLVKTADAVVVATVIDIRPGRLAGDPADGSAGLVQMFDVTLSIDQTIKGGMTGAVSIEIMPIASPGGLAGFPPFDPEQPWWSAGAQSVYFLTTTTPERVLPLGSQGVMFLPQGASRGQIKVVATSDFAAEVEALGLAGLQQRIDSVRE